MGERLRKRVLFYSQVALCILVFLIGSCLVPKTTASVKWSQVYGEGSVTISSSVIQTSDLGFALVGTIKNSQLVGSDIYLVRTNSEGITLWNSTYGLIGDENAYSIVQTNDQGFILVGRISNAPDEINSEAWIVKVDSQGTVQWTQKYGVSTRSYASFIFENDNGTFTVVGSAEVGGKFDAWLFTIDSDGKMLWNNTYGSSEIDAVECAARTVDGDYAVGGHKFESHLAWMIRVGSNGDLKWQKTYGMSASDPFNIFTSIVPLNDGGFAVTAMSPFLYGGAQTADGWLLRLDAMGNLQWKKSYDLTGNYHKGTTQPNCIIQRADGGFVIVGIAIPMSGSQEIGQYSWLIKTDASGLLETASKYTVENAKLVLASLDGEYILSGETKGFARARVQANAFLIETDGNDAPIELTNTSIFSPTPTSSSSSSPSVSPSPSPSIPEFPAWVALPLIAATCLGVLVYVRRGPPPARASTIR
jgi:hypothetical protein